jgi:A/G-specific adenine glycosylase
MCAAAVLRSSSITASSLSDDVQLRIRKALATWWESHKRDFPWRHTSDPYKILLAEVLLHRTRAEQVVAIYNNLLDVCPTIEALAALSTAEVRELLHPLGLHWRADLLLRMAQIVVEEHNAEIPVEVGVLNSLPGIGPYASGAVRCFAFGHPEPLLDVNTVRILARLIGIPISDGQRRSRPFRELMSQLLDRDNPQQFNYALLDLGAMVCRSSGPSCAQCPLLFDCSTGKSTMTVGAQGNVTRTFKST